MNTFVLIALILIYTGQHSAGNARPSVIPYSRKFSQDLLFVGLICRLHNRSAATATTNSSTPNFLAYMCDNHGPQPRLYVIHIAISQAFSWFEPRCACSKRQSQPGNMGGAVLEHPSVKIRPQNLWSFPICENSGPRENFLLYSIVNGLFMTKRMTRRVGRG